MNEGRKQLIWKYKTSPLGLRFSSLIFDFFTSDTVFSQVCASYVVLTAKKLTTIPDAHRKKRTSWKLSVRQIDKQVKHTEHTDLQICIVMMDNSLGNRYGRKFSLSKKRKKDHLFFVFYIDRQSTLR